MSYKLCTLKVTDGDGYEFFQTAFLNSDEFRKLIAEGAELIEIID